MSSTVYIMMGLPGSGKSTLSRKLASEEDGYIFSTDRYWLRPDGYYDFNINRIREAHKWNQDRFVQVLRFLTSSFSTKFLPDLSVDNTNLDLKSIKPYVDAAIAAGYKVELIEPSTEWKYDVDECFKRNTHAVPRVTIENMLNKLNANRDSIIAYIKESNGHNL